MMASQTRNSLEAIAKYNQAFDAFLSNLPHNKQLKLESETEPVSKTKPASNHVFIETVNNNTSELEGFPEKPSMFYVQQEKFAVTQHQLHPDMSKKNVKKLPAKDYKDLPEEKEEKCKKIAEEAKKANDGVSTSQASGYDLFSSGEPSHLSAEDTDRQCMMNYRKIIDELIKKHEWDSCGDDSLDEDDHSDKSDYKESSSSESRYDDQGSDFGSDHDEDDDYGKKKCEYPSGSVMMSSAEDKNCFTVTWEIENYSLLLESSENILRSSPFKTNTTEECAWWRLCASHSVLYAMFDLSRLGGSTVLDQCQLFLITSSGKIPLGKDGSDLKFYIEINSILGDNGKSKFPNGTLTLCCKMWETKMKAGESRHNSVLYKLNFSWDSKERNSGAHDYIFNDQNNCLLYINVQEMSKRGEHKVIVGSLPSGDSYVSILDCDLSITDGYVDTKKSIFPFISCICDIVKNKGSGLQFQLECIYAVHNSKSTLDSCCTLSKDLLQIYQEKTFSDATLVTEGKNFSANRIILAARSPVFSAMLKNQMSEDCSGVLIIEDIDSETLGRMLVFLYSDSLEEVKWEEASALYSAADKYAVPYLKQKCGDLLKGGLAVANACEALILADKHSDQELMKCTVDFIRDHTEVFTLDKWEKLEESNSKLALKCFREVIVKK